jgi:hypothetical protein
VTYLLDKGADPNIQNKAGSTTLHKVVLAKYDQVAILRKLLAHKADPLIRNSAGLLAEQIAGGLVCVPFPCEFTSIIILRTRMYLMNIYKIFEKKIKNPICDIIM